MPMWTTWWYTPHRTRTRRVLFQVHFWLGVLLGLYTVVIGITGSALVFLPELMALHPAAAGTGPGRTSALTPVLARIAAEYPREQVLGVDNLDHPALAAVVYLNAPDADWVKGEQRMVSVDQRTGAILGERLRVHRSSGYVRKPAHLPAEAGRRDMSSTVCARACFYCCALLAGCYGGRAREAWGTGFGCTGERDGSA